jgi:hypothetical protein
MGEGSHAASVRPPREAGWLLGLGDGVQAVPAGELLLHPGDVGGEIGLPALQALLELSESPLLLLESCLPEFEVGPDLGGSVFEGALSVLELLEPLLRVLLDAGEALLLTRQAQPAGLETLLLARKRECAFLELARTLAEDGGEAVELVPSRVGHRHVLVAAPELLP